ncbi:MspA family porin, partial [Rhodococcus sp. BS-15]|uniref:MspA family porin n=1 Tax=Rhodococcus sp. BS-15 TaxID=1304954 RepID=UPI001F17C176
MAGCAVVSAAVMVGSVAFAGTASATPTPLADKFASTVTDDGWTLDLTASNLSVNPVPNVATTAFTREGFVSAKVTGTITGAGETAVKTGYIEQG